MLKSRPKYKYGNLPAQKASKTLRFQDYVAAPAFMPPAINVLPRVYGQLGVNDPTILFPMDGNIQYFDCDIAAVAHAITVYNGLVGKRNILTEADVVNLYLRFTNGANIGLRTIDVLNYWQMNPISGDQILAFVSIDPTNHVHLQQSIQLFGGVYLGFNVQQNAQEDFNNRQAWVPAPLTGHFHAVYGVGYDPNGLTVLTWGNTQQATWAWNDACVYEAYAILPPEAALFNPGGFDVAQLRADLQQLANA
jgi:hypothetical protein